jgi:hypothetical protein
MASSAPRRHEHAVATRAQLTAAGWTEGQIRAEIAGRRWQSLNENVVCRHNGPLTREQGRLAVLLGAQRPAALCGLTALELAGISGFETSTVHIVVRRGARVLPVPGVTVSVHESRRFEAGHIRERRGLLVTSPARAVMDAAVWSKESRTAARIMVAAVQQRRVSARDLSAELLAAGFVRHRKALLLLLQDLEGGAEALSEVEFLAFCRRHGLPRPRLQYRLDSAGRRRYLDAVFVGPGGVLIRVEIDGGIHLTLTARWRDTAKDNDAALDGATVLRFPSVAIYTDDPRAVAQLRRALGCQHLAGS